MGVKSEFESKKDTDKRWIEGTVTQKKMIWIWRRLFHLVKTQAKEPLNENCTVEVMKKCQTHNKNMKKNPNANGTKQEGN